MDAHRRALTDFGMAGLRDGLQPGLTERALADLVERAYIALGGTNVIHFFGVINDRSVDRRANAICRQPQS